MLSNPLIAKENSVQFSRYMKKSIDKCICRCYNFYAVREQSLFDIYKMGYIPSIRVGIDCDEGPPVPIPNTEVKHTYADDSCRVTGRENR